MVIYITTKISIIIRGDGSTKKAVSPSRYYQVGQISFSEFENTSATVVLSRVLVYPKPTLTHKKKFREEFVEGELLILKCALD